MSYSRPSQIPNEQRVVEQFEQAIKSLVTWFREHPYACYTETDMHCYLYHRLYRGGIVNGLYKTAEGYDTILLHKEYPTDGRYSRLIDRSLKPDPSGRRRGAFDISIWDPKYIGGREHREQKVLCAAELALNECGTRNKHTRNDALKLTDPRNAVAHPYLLFFVRDEPDFERNKQQIIGDLEDAANKGVRVVLAIHNGGKRKPKPVAFGSWLTTPFEPYMGSK